MICHSHIPCLFSRLLFVDDYMVTFVWVIYEYQIDTAEKTYCPLSTKNFPLTFLQALMCMKEHKKIILIASLLVNCVINREIMTVVLI